MTDELPDETADEPAGEAPKIRVRRGDGPWEELPPSEPLSDNPQIEAIGDLGMGELRRILDDADDPQHDAAVEYSRLLGERMQSQFEGFLPFKGLGLPNPFASVGEALLRDSMDLIADALPNPFAGVTEAIGQNYLESIADALPGLSVGSLVELPKYDQAQLLGDPEPAQPLRPDVPNRPRQGEPLTIPRIENAVETAVRDLIKVIQENADQDRRANQAAIESAEGHALTGRNLGIAGLVVAILSLLAAIGAIIVAG